MRQRKTLAQLADKLKMVAGEIGDGGWVFDDYQRGGATFRPIKVDKFGKERLWQHGKKWLLMSATVISPDTLAESLGWDKSYGMVSVPHTFPVENRKVNVVPVASITHKTKDTSYPLLANAVANLADIHASERMLIHTVSYDLTNYLADFLKFSTDSVDSARVLTYTRAGEREAVLAKFRKTVGGILLAPSMDRGVDLPGEDAQVVVIAKVPWGSLGSKQISQRKNSPGGDTWYSVEAIRSLVQMSGRHIRSADDRGVTYILDAQFGSNVWAKSRHLLPAWFKEALDFNHPKRLITQAR
jgi:ATP-dependent DNA helicase DinG